MLIAHGCDIDVRDNEVLNVLALLVQKTYNILTLTRLPGGSLAVSAAAQRALRPNKSFISLLVLEYLRSGTNISQCMLRAALGCSC